MLNRRRFAERWNEPRFPQVPGVIGYDPWLRMLLLAGPMVEAKYANERVAEADMRTSMNDLRIAVRLRLGDNTEDLDADGWKARRDA